MVGSPHLPPLAPLPLPRCGRGRGEVGSPHLAMHEIHEEGRGTASPLQGDTRRWSRSADPTYPVAAGRGTAALRPSIYRWVASMTPWLFG
jgi:hypothetical protein